jgi:hypothetical protein
LNKNKKIGGARANSGGFRPGAGVKTPILCRNAQEVADAQRRVAKTGFQQAIIDLPKIEMLAQLACTMEEIGWHVGAARETIYHWIDVHPEVAEAIERGKANGRISLRRSQFKNALAGNATMQIWLGKQLLGQRDDPSGAIEAGGSNVVEAEWVESDTKSLTLDSPANDISTTSLVPIKASAVQ